MPCGMLLWVVVRKEQGWTLKRLRGSGVSQMPDEHVDLQYSGALACLENQYNNASLQFLMRVYYSGYKSIEPTAL